MKKIIINLFFALFVMFLSIAMWKNIVIAEEHIDNKESSEVEKNFEVNNINVMEKDLAGTSMANSVVVSFDKRYSINWGTNGSPYNTYHKITIPEQGLVTIHIDKPLIKRPNNPEYFGYYNLRIYDSQGNMFVDSSSANDVSNPNTYYEYSYGLKAGTYYFNIVPSFAALLTTNEVTASYYFSFSGTKWCETESNNGFGTSSKISINGMNKASFGQNGTDYDFYQVQLEAGHRYRFKIYNYYSAINSSLLAVLYDSDKNNIGLSSKMVFDNDGALYYDIDISSTGRYYLELGSTRYLGIRNYEVGVYDVTSSNTLEDFVSRMYTVALNRSYDTIGKLNWVNALKVGTHDGAAIAREFILGQEFALRNLSNDDYIETLYLTFFDRNSDSAGKANWLNHLAVGYSREFILSQFVNSDEFTNLCQSFGVERGVMNDDGSTIKVGIPQFVNRLYLTVMNRNADGQGYKNWTMVLVTKQQSAEQVAKSFFTSQEYLNKDTNNTTFINDLYRTFFDREPDSTGLTNWKNCLATGMTRITVIAEFAKSAEFKIIAARYGLQ